MPPFAPLLLRPWHSISVHYMVYVESKREIFIGFIFENRYDVCVIKHFDLETSDDWLSTDRNFV